MPAYRFVDEFRLHATPTLQSRHRMRAPQHMTLATLAMINMPLIAAFLFESYMVIVIQMPLQYGRLFSRCRAVDEDGYHLQQRDLSPRQAGICQEESRDFAAEGIYYSRCVGGKMT